MISAAQTKPPAVASQLVSEAWRMIELFASVGADRFDLTHTNLQQEKRGFRAGQTLEQVRGSLPYLVPSSARRQNNVIVRPRSTQAIVSLVQLDDLTAENLARIAPFAFLTLQTSTQGVQAWLAVNAAPAGFAARLKAGIGADPEASGATRVAGTANFKTKYAPDFPIVRILQAQPGKIVTAAELEGSAVVAPAKPSPPPLPVAASSTVPRTHKWPDYQRCLDGAPEGTFGNPRRTSVDFIWCKIALSWGHGIEETAVRLREVSSKARENREVYARQTAEHAEFAARQRNAQPRRY